MVPGGTAVSGPYLPEVAEHDAEGSTADIYADIRRVLGLPVVNLIYRHLAVEPARLAGVWQALRPNLSSRAADDAARRLVELAAPAALSPLSGAVLAAVGLNADRARLARTTLNAYARANSLNLLGMHALLDGCPGTHERGDVPEPPPAVPILSMAQLDTLPTSTLELLSEMTVALVGGEQPVLVPSLLRHFATDPALLALIWTALRPAAAELAARRTAVAARARELASSLPQPVEPLEKRSDRETATRFAVAMSTLLVTGEAVRAAIAEAP
jgi:hypothetical protein